MDDEFGLSSEILSNIVNILGRYKKISRAVIFGSRARGDYRKTSDIDLCIFSDGLDEIEPNLISDAIEELDTPYRYDILFFDKLKSEDLKENILKEGIAIYVREKD